ncbi:hypothetical protein KQ939_03325 [Planococcus sp. CP5-4]|uniref:hypothetical protein n=1 Tax=unclassified Planococcus (in: firmicutes) TaxID=2662419 RepID=UPI001C21262B|nr:MULTISPECIES: hypothetical protein [unclassified Planococcus (in: firmicutes)]MBU9672011.1 hypothetical protein [Planococcus sp. CP5-4_YE]MBV0907574.1 hypothetical protein [Planococcus sp. CP5-4_UN]MBW6062741.1 hypothetical protein [Planococcus sp. CP5-4]
MRDEEIPPSPSVEEDQEQREPRLIQPYTKPWIHFGYFVFVLTILSVAFSLIKVMAD